MEKCCSKCCSKCKEWKDIGEFNKTQYKCKSCQKKYYEKNKKQILSNKEKRYHENPKKFKIIQLKYTEANKDKIKLYKSKWYQEHKKKLSEESKLKYNINPEPLKSKSKLYRKNNKNIIRYKEKIYYRSISLYETYYERLTIDEIPRLSDDGISLEVKCRYCGKYFKPTNLQVKNRIQAINGSLSGDLGLYCSDKCKEACPIYRKQLYPEGHKKATSREVQLRQLVLKRDKYKCIKCGNTEELHCHHIYPLNESPVTSADIDECITLCIDCHKWVHMNVVGCGYHEMKCSTKEVM